MATRWSLTIDCAHPARLAEFWAFALGYVSKPPPAGFAGWEEWLEQHGVPEEEWDEGAALSDPDGVGPSLSFMQVPESKVVKNRLHLDVQVGGGRETPWEIRWPRVVEAVERRLPGPSPVAALATRRRDTMRVCYPPPTAPSRRTSTTCAD